MNTTRDRLALERDSEAVHRLLLDCGFRDAPWPPRGPRRWSVVGRPVEDLEIVIGCVAEGSGFHLRVQPSAARELVAGILEQHDVRGVSVRAEPPATEPRPWLAVGAAVSAVALFAWSLIGS